MLNFCQKNVHSLEDTVFWCYFFKFHMKHPILPCPYLVIKKRQFCQNYYILWAQKINRMPCFPIFHEQISSLMPTFCPKQGLFSKNTLLSCPYFVNKTSILSKTLCSHVIFFYFFMENPCCHANIWSNDVIQNYIILLDKKSIGCPFADFYEKLLSCQYVVIKMSIL